MKLVSIVIPVYNAAKTLSRCVDSVLDQSYSRFELILINDGSTDESESICKAYSKQDSRVHLYTQTNSGVSVSRNNGIKHATGEFLVFIDSDDYIDKEFIANFFKTDPADLTFQGYKIISSQNTILRIKHFPRTNRWEDAVAFAEDNNIINSPWAKLFSRSIIKEHSLCFDESISYGEDHLFVLQYLYHTKNVVSVNQTDYNYCMAYNDSLSNKLIPYERECDYVRKLRLLQNELLSKVDWDEKVQESFNRRFYKSLMKLLLDCYRTENSTHAYKYTRSIIKPILNHYNKGLGLGKLMKIGIYKYINLSLLFILRDTQNRI